MAQLNQEIQYAYLDSSANWENYLAYRPRYPKSTEKLIISHHRSHSNSNSFRLAHDVGSGSAVFVPRLAEYFEHVHVSDPSPTTLARARERIGKLEREGKGKCTFSFSETKAEECDLPCEEGSFDLMFIGMAAHWPEDTERMIDAVARSLRSKGTLAVVNYAPCCRVVDNEQVDVAVQRLWRTWGARFAKEASRRIERNNSPLDFIELRDELWIQDATKRIKINFREKGDGAFVIPSSGGRVAASRVGEKQRQYAFSDEDEEGAGWRKEVDGQWFRGYLRGLEKEENLHLYGEELEGVKKAICETTQDGKVVVEWAASILLATRK